MQKLLKYIILIGIFTLPIINSRITELLWFSFSMPVDWNYEFTKVMFFNIWSSLVISLFFINIFINKYKIKLNIFIFFFYIILLISTFLSESPIISFLWNTDKSHSFLMWSNLVWLFIVFKNTLDKEFFSKIIKTFIYSWIFVSLLWLKEYFYPTFNYWDLWNRVFSTFWHPNYLSIFLVSLIPFLYQKKWYINKAILLLFIITLIFTKSLIALFLFLVFNIYYFWKKIKYKKILISLIVLLWFTLIYIFIPEKLHSFVSRFFIWETTIRIIFSDIKIFLIGWWTETLNIFFNSFKSEYVYIFENLGYTADRPHNIILNFFYFFWIWGLVFILWIYYKIFNLKVGNENVHSLQVKTSLILIFIFLLFNPTSIIIYLIIIILLANLFNKQDRSQNIKSSFLETCLKILFFYITIISIFWAYNSYNFYISQTQSHQENYSQALNIYKYNPELYFIKGDLVNWLKISTIKTQNYYKYKLRYINILNKEWQIIISEFLQKYNYAENYFYIWDLFWNKWKKEIAKKYYKKWLEILPDLWNKDSKYYDDFLVKKLKIDDHRLTSEKYWLAKVLKRVK